MHDRLTRIVFNLRLIVTLYWRDIEQMSSDSCSQYCHVTTVLKHPLFMISLLHYFIFQLLCGNAMAQETPLLSLSNYLYPLTSFTVMFFDVTFLDFTKILFSSINKSIFFFEISLNGNGVEYPSLHEQILIFLNIWMLFQYFVFLFFNLNLTFARFIGLHYNR